MYTSSVIVFCIWFVPLPNEPQTAGEWLAQNQCCRRHPYELPIAQGVFGTLSDVYLLAIPVQSILALRIIPLRKRIGVSLMFGTGIM